VPPSATARPTLRPTAAPPTPRLFPILAANYDATLAKLATQPEMQLLAVGDRFVIGGDTSGETPKDLFAYDPATGLTRSMPSAGKGRFDAQFSVGDLVVGQLFRAPTSQTPATWAIVIENVTTGTVRTVLPRAGYNMILADAVADGYAFGQMTMFVMPEGGSTGGSLESTRAIVIDVATGVLTDLTPADAPSRALASVAGVADGHALVVVREGDVAGERRITSLALVDIATGDRNAIGLDVIQLARISEVWDPQELRLDGDLIVARVRDAARGIDRVVVDRWETGVLQDVPADPSATTTACPFRLDAARLVCVSSFLDAGGNRIREDVLFVHDLDRQATTTLQTTGLTDLILPVAVSDGRILVRDFSGHPPIVYVGAGGIPFQLGTLPGMTTSPDQMSIVGGRIVGNDYGAFDPRVWLLP
jgi:hypothetical protein